jgi:hypothetical protein
LDLLSANLLSPVVLAFALGLIARGLRSDLDMPPAIQAYLAIFLLLAIGMKGGVALHQASPPQPRRISRPGSGCATTRCRPARWPPTTDRCRP